MQVTGKNWGGRKGQILFWSTTLSLYMRDWQGKKPLIAASFKWGTSQIIINGPLLLQPVIGWLGPGIFAYLHCHPVTCRYLPILSPTLNTNLLPLHLLYRSVYLLHFPSHITILKVTLPVLSNNPILSHLKTNITFSLHTKSTYSTHTRTANFKFYLPLLSKPF
jgi:hypothetical protein